LLPSRASFRALRGVFLFGVAFLLALPFAGATLARRAPRVAFFAAFVSGAVSVCSVVDVMVFLLAR
jgi:hypothetical protein